MCSESDPTLGTMYTSRSDPNMFSMLDMEPWQLLFISDQDSFFYVSFVRHYYLLQSHGNLVINRLRKGLALGPALVVLRLDKLLDDAHHLTSRESSKAAPCSGNLIEFTHRITTESFKLTRLVLS